MLKSERGNLRTLHMAVRWIMFVLVFVFQLSPAIVLANPTGGEVVAGQADISNAGTTTTINQATQTAIINWQDFSIAGGELTKFVQPNAQSAVLNKVIGNNVSQIYGTLQANGQVFLVNQSGIFVGAGGVINTAGFVASTLDLDTETFMRGGDMKFAGNSQASIVNLGTINGTSGVFLISQKIENSGKISSPNGEVGLAAGSEVLLRQSGDERTSVLVGSSASGTGISNKGEIQAAVATMKATGSMYSVAVNNEGIVRAQGVNMSGGKVRLTGLGGTVISSGTLSAKTSDEKGGTVIAEGKNVGLIGNAVVDVSGKKGGGTALIGGDYRGSNPDVINAEKTFVGTGAKINADATESGDGGKVVVWADSATTYQGSLSARGGEQSGNGGFAEVSGKEVLAFTGTADLGAANGSRGTLLLDPKNIIINNAGPALLADVDAFADTPAADSFINVATINAAVANVVLQANNDITQSVGANIVLAPNLSLTMQAGRSIIIVGNVTLSGTGAFTATINDGAADAPNRDAGVAVFNSFGAGGITTGGGAVTVGVGNFGGIQEGVVNVTNSTILSNGGNITLNGFGGLGTPDGVILSSGNISALGGNIAITGTSFAGAGVNSSGVFMNSGSATTTGTGTLSITGTNSSTGTNGNAGVSISSATLSTVNGLLSVTGTGSANSTGFSNNGILINNGALSNSGSGGITVLGTGGSGTDSNNGVFLSSGNVTSTGTGAISITGTASSATTGNNNVGVGISGGATISNSGSGGTTLLGTGGSGTDFNSGVALLSGNVTSTVTGSGAISITGTARSTTTGNNNIGVSNFAQIRSLNAVGGSSITINGTGGTGTSFNSGVGTSGGTISTISGDILITGNATTGNSLDDNDGVAGTGGSITSTGLGSITVNGTTDASVSNLNRGINLGAITISSTTSNIALTALAAGNNTVAFRQAGTISSTSGNITMTASGAATTDFDHTPVGSINAGSGNVAVVANTAELAVGTTITTTGNVSIAQFTNNQLIDLGANTVGRLALTSAELNTITASSIQIGNANSGNILIAGSIAPSGTNTLILQTGGSNSITQTAGFTITESNLGLQAGTGAITLTEANAVTNLAANTAGNLTYTDATGINIGTAGTVAGVNTGAGIFTLLTNGAVTQTQALVSGVTSITAGAANDITLNDVNNVIAGTLNLSGNDLAIRNTVATVLGTVTANLGSFSLTTSDDNVTQTGVLDVGTTTTLSTGTGSITLNAATNNLVGAIALTTTTATGDVQITNNASAGTILAASTVGGDLIIVQQDQGGSSITQTGALVVNGQASFTNLTTNRGDVTVDNTAAAGGTVLGAGTTTVAGDYTLAASAGGVTQTGAVRVRGTLTTTGGTTVLDRDDNVLANAASLSGGSIFFRKIGVVDINTDISGTINTGAGSLTIISLEDGINFTSAEINGTAIDLNSFANNFSGGLVVNTGGAANTFANVTGQPAGINQNTATLTVGGTSTFRAIDGTDGGTTVGAININGTNSLTGPISFIGQNATLVNSTATNLAASVLTGNLSVSSTGNITNSGALNVTGTSNFVGTTSGNTITVNNAGNLLTGAVSFTKTGTGNVILNNNQATVLGNVTTNGGDFSVTSNGNLTQLGATAIIQNVGGALNVITTGLGSNAVLTSASNSILSLNNVTTAGNFQFYEANGYNVTGTLAVTGFAELGVQAGSVNQTAGSITSAGLLLSQVNAVGTGTFSINQPGNAVGTIASQQFAAGSVTNITLVNDGSLAIGTVNGVNGIGGVNTVGTGNVNLTSSTGAITRSGISAVNMGGGILTLTASTGVGLAGTPILTTGTHTLSGSTTTGGFFTQNDTSGNVTVGGTGITALGSIRINNTFGSLTVGQAIDSTGGAGNIQLDSGTTMTVAANVGSALTNNVTINNTGLFDSNLVARLTTSATGAVIFSGAGQIGNSAVDAALVSTTDVNFNRATATSAAFVSTDTAGRVRGSINGNLDFRSTGGSDITLGNTSGPQNLTMGANGALSSIVIISSGQILSGGTLFANGADVALQGVQIGTTAVSPLALDGVDALEARAIGGGIFLSHTGSNLIIGEVSAAVATSGLNATGEIILNQAANRTLIVANNVTAPGNISLIIANSGPGLDQLFVNPGVTVGSGAGGNIIIAGGVNNQGSVTATAGSTTTLDGGRPNLTLGGTQNFNGNVTFSVSGDIEVTGRITQTSATGSITLIADSDLNNFGGIIITDQVDSMAFIRSAGTMDMTASQLGFTTLAGNAFTNNGNGIVVIGASTTVPIVGGTLGSGGITMTTRPAAGPVAVSNIIINGVIQNNVAGTNITIDSSDQIQVGDNVISVNNLTINNEGSMTRTAGAATLRTGGTGTLLFTGAGQLGAMATAMLTRAGNIDFDSSSGTKASADAFISEFDGAGIIGELDQLVMTAAGTVFDIGLLEMNRVSIVTTSGAIDLNNTVHLIDQFDTMTAINSIDYTGGTNLILAGPISTNASGAVNINVTGFDLTQNVGADIGSNNITLVMNTGTLNATIDRTLVGSTAALVVNITNTGLLTTAGAPAQISATSLNVDGSGDVGNNLSDGLHTTVGTLFFDKTDGDLYVLESTAGVTSLTGNLGLSDTLNVSTTQGNINIGIAGVTVGNLSNVHLIAGGPTTSQVTQTPGGFINMDGGELLLVGRQGIGQPTFASAIQTTGDYILSAQNAGTTGGIYVINGDGATTSGTDHITIGSINAFTPGSTAVQVAFNGLNNTSTATTGFRDIGILNLQGDIILSQRVEVANNAQNVYFSAANTGARIRQGTANGVIRMKGTSTTAGIVTGGNVLLASDAGVGNSPQNAGVNDAIRTSGTLNLAGQSTTDGGFFVTNIDDAGALGNVTIGSATNPFTSVTFNGINTFGAALGDIRVQNRDLNTGNITINQAINPATGRNVALISDAGAIRQGLLSSGILNMTGGGLILSASTGIGSLAAPAGTPLFGGPILITGATTLSVRNTGTTGNINVQNDTSGTITIANQTDAYDTTVYAGGSNVATGANQGAIRIVNNATGAGNGDIVVSPIAVSTTGGPDAFILLQASDDVIIGAAGQAAATSISTVNGAITLTAANGNVTDGADGVLISGGNSFATTITGGGAGNIAISATTTLNSDVTVTNGTRIFQTGTGSITITAADDFVNFGGAGIVEGEIQTTNGAISITATNTAVDDVELVTGTSVITNGIYVLGGTIANQDLTINAQGVNGTLGLTATANTGRIRVTGGNNTNATTLVQSSGAMSINATGLPTGPGTLSATDSSAALLVQGGTASGASATINSTNTGATAQTLTLAAGGLRIQGGTALNSSATVTTSGTQTANVTGVTAVDSILINGGTGDVSTATLSATTGTGNQAITLSNGNMSILGGNGLNADANVTAAGTSQAITVSSGSLLVSANQNAVAANSDALISLLNNVGGVGIQTINVTTGGIIIRGGLGATESATINMLDADGRQSIRLITDGDLLVEGGNGITSSALISSAGLNGVGAGNEAQNILIDAGQLIVRSNQDAVNGGSTAIISQTNSGAASQIITVNGLAPTDGTMSLLGGAGVNEGLLVQSAGTVAQTITLAQGLTILGGSGSGSFSGILSTGTGQAQTVTVTTGNATLTGGTGSGSFGFINQMSATGTQVVTVTGASALSNLTITGGNGFDADAAIVSSGVTQTITVSNGNLLVTGNQDAGAANSDALIDSTNNGVTQTISVSGATAGLITIQGGAGATETAGIRTNGIQAITAANGISVTGGSGQDSTAFITKQGDINDTQNITVTVGNFAILGGTGVNADANVTSNGLTQTINVLNGALTVQGDQTNAATANADALVSLLANAAGTAVQSINVTNGGVIVRGGVGATETATISMLDADGRQSIRLITDGDMLVEGGDGEASIALVTSAGLDAGAGSEAQRIIIDAGQLIVSGNQNAVEENSSATISQTNTGAASQIITVSGLAGTDGTVSVLGGSGTFETALITSAGTVAQTITIARGLTITGGSGMTSTAGISATGVGEAQSITVTTGDATLTGGTGQDTTAFIRQTQTTGSQTILVSGASALSNLSLTGGNGLNADAEITAAGTIQSITVSNGNLLVTGNADAGAANSDALIDSTNNGVTQTISVSGAGAGLITILGGAGMTETAGIRTNGIQAITAANGITVTGGSGQDSTAFIVKQGDINDTQNITVTLGNFAILGGMGVQADANVTSNGLTQTINVLNGALTVQGDQTNAATANADALVSLLANAAGTAIQSINVTNGGVIVRGGVGATETATISMLDADGRQSIRAITAGNVQVLGGNGFSSSASILSAGINGGGANEQAQRIVIENGNLVVDAGSASTSSSTAGISATNTGAATQFIDVEGTISVLGGDGGGEPAFISSAGFNTANGLAQDINSLNAMLIQSGDSGSSGASIESTGAFGRQQVVVQTGNLSILAGTGGGNQTFIRGAGDNLAVGQEAQRVIVSSGNLIIDANSGTGGNSAFISMTNATTATQFIDVEGTISVLAGDGGGEDASIISAGFNAAQGLAQDINALSGMRIEGGNAGGDDAFIDATGLQGRQLVVVQNNNLEILGGIGGGQSARISSAGLNGAGVSQEAQRILVQVGNLIMNGGDATNNGTTVTIRQINTGAATQFVDVEGRIDVLAGDGGGETASITAAGFNAAQGLAQTINALSGLRIEGGNASGGNDAFIDATGLQGRQLVVVQNNNLEILGGIGSGQSARISSAGLNGAGVSQEAQRILVQVGNLIMNGGDATNNGTTVTISQSNTGAATQFIDVNGTLTVQAGAGTNENATISAAGFDAAAGPAQNIDILSGASLTGGGAGSNARILATGANGTQTILVQANNLSLLGGIGNSASALIDSAGLVQNLTVSNGALLVRGDLTAAVTGGASARIRNTNTSGAQTINVTNGGITVTGGIGALEFADIVTIGATSTQNINTLAAGSITVNGGSGAGAYGAISAGGTQDINSVTSINVNGGTAAGAFGAIEKANAGTQGLTATTTINLNDGTGALARVSHTGGGAQTLTSTGTTNLTGDSGFQALIESTGTSNLINAGGTWTGVANVTATTSVTIQNSGAIVVNETPGTGMVTAPTLIFVNGTSLVGTTGAANSASTRLRTTVDTIDFQSVGIKTVNLRESDAVAVQGTVGTVNMVAGGTISNAAAELTATNATFRATAGDINLDNPANSVGTFNGLISDAGSITYNGDSATTFANRLVDGDAILAGAGVFAQTNITVNLSAGAMTVTADQILSNAGNMNYTAAGGIALSGGTKVLGTAPGAGDGLVTTLNGTQTYNNAVTLNRDYLITASGAPDTITFNSTIDGPGGLGIGSTPNFNGNVGATIPLAYLNLNSPVNSNFNFNNGLVVVNGSIVNQGGGDLNVIGNNMIFVVDNGTVGPGAGVFTGGNMTGGGLNTLTIFAANPAGVSGSAIPATQNFLVWNGTPGGAAVLPGGFAVAVNFKAPPPPDNIKDKKNKRKDIEGDFTVSYEEGANAGTMVTVSGIPLAEPATADGAKVRTGGLLTTSYGVNSPEAINTFYFGREVQTPIQIETAKLVTGAKGSPNRN